MLPEPRLPRLMSHRPVLIFQWSEAELALVAALRLAVPPHKLVLSLAAVWSDPLQRLCERR